MHTLSDIKAKTVSEEYTPLHLAACYLRHASKPCKSATNPAEIADQPAKENETTFNKPADDLPDIAEEDVTEAQIDVIKSTEATDQLPKGGSTTSRKTESDTATSVPPKRRHSSSSAMPIKRQVSCKEVFQVFEKRQEIVATWVSMHVKKKKKKKETEIHSKSEPKL